ncbi:MAG: hypothetical protein ACTSXK_13460 [Promethearchaeota archaeon]
MKKKEKKDNDLGFSDKNFDEILIPDNHSDILKQDLMNITSTQTKIYLFSSLLNIILTFIIGIWLAIDLNWIYGFFSVTAIILTYIIYKFYKQRPNQIQTISVISLIIGLLAIVGIIDVWPIYIILIFAILDCVVLIYNFIIGQKLDRKLLHESRANKKK